MSNARNLARLLPDSSGKIALPSQVSGVLPDANAPSGSVIQVVQSKLNTSAETTSTSYVSTGLSASITPQFSTSKILVVVSAAMGISSSGSCFATLYKNSTNLGGGGYASFIDLYGTNNYTSASINYLDSPATTSSTTYSLYYFQNGGCTVRLNPNEQTSTITLMEIAG